MRTRVARISSRDKGPVRIHDQEPHPSIHSRANAEWARSADRRRKHRPILAPARGPEFQTELRRTSPSATFHENSSAEDTGKTPEPATPQKFAPPASYERAWPPIKVLFSMNNTVRSRPRATVSRFGRGVVPPSKVPEQSSSEGLRDEFLILKMRLSGYLDISSVRADSAKKVPSLPGTEFGDSPKVARQASGDERRALS